MRKEKRNYQAHRNASLSASWEPNRGPLDTPWIIIALVPNTITNSIGEFKVNPQLCASQIAYIWVFVSFSSFKFFCHVCKFFKSLQHAHFRPTLAPILPSQTPNCGVKQKRILPPYYKMFTQARTRLKNTLRNITYLIHLHIYIYIWNYFYSNSDSNSVNFN